MIDRSYSNIDNIMFSLYYVASYALLWDDNDEEKYYISYAKKLVRKGADVNKALSQCFERLTYKFQSPSFQSNPIYSEIFGSICTSSAVSYSRDNEYHLDPNQVRNQIKIAYDIHKWILNIVKEIKEEDERALMAIRVAIKMKLPFKGPNKIIRSYL
tara:strand:- start:2141 stop:2611 length:471 start_codon:yes stop_codon:yes gene_type:complete